MQIERPRDCPFCTHGELDVVTLERNPMVILAVRCPECGATGPRSESPETGARGVYVESAQWSA